MIEGDAGAEEDIRSWHEAEGFGAAGGIGDFVDASMPRPPLMRWTAPHKASRCRRVIVDDESP